MEVKLRAGILAARRSSTATPTSDDSRHATHGTHSLTNSIDSQGSGATWHEGRQSGAWTRSVTSVGQRMMSSALRVPAVCCVVCDSLRVTKRVSDVVVL